MLAVRINQSQFIYDIHSLVKAFYPAEDVKVFVGQEAEETVSSDGLPDIRIDFGEEGIAMTLAGENGPWSSYGALKRNASGLEGVAPGLEGVALDLKRLSPDSKGAAYGGREVSCGKGADRAEVKNLLKRLIYQSLSEYLGRELPWGTLTGIRPTKIPMTMLEEGKSEEEILSHMRETYLISEKKGRLSIAVAKKEKELLSGLHCEDGYSLYIGIPFCPTTCLYCSFTSYPIGVWKDRVGEYLTALEKEMAFQAKAGRGRILDTVYIGGGTPTTLTPEELERLFDALERHFDLSGIKEFTVEAGRADSITADKLKVLKRHHVTRISVNPQTMKEDTLRLIGRRHTVEQVRQAFLLARAEGFDNINMDIILGLPEETEDDVRHTVKEIEKLCPDSLTVHSLALKRASGMQEWIEKNGIVSLNNTEATMEIAAVAAKNMGMEPYYLYRQKNMTGNLENVGYASPGKCGIYNILIMEEKQSIAALGAGTISKAVYPDGRIERCDNVKDVGLYIERIDEMIDRKKRLFGWEEK